MKKNRMMRLASVLLVLTLLSTSVISGTFAKYTSTANSTDTARVAKWGFTNTSSITLDNLFANAYTNETGIAGVTIDGTDNIIAPGTTNSVSFSFVFAGENGVATAPEVDYTFEVTTADSTIGTSIENNPNIQWKLDDGNWLVSTAEKSSWDQLLEAIDALDGDATGNKYEAGTLPTAFYGTGTSANGAATHTVSWQWIFETPNDTDTDNDGVKEQDEVDTLMGNAADLEKVTLKIAITATQVD